MSFLKELQIENDIVNFSIEQYKENIDNLYNTSSISVEDKDNKGIISKIIDVIKNIINGFKKIYNNIKYKLLMYFHDRKQKETTKNLKFLLTTNLIPDSVLNPVIWSFFELKGNAGWDKVEWDYVFKNNGEFKDLNEIINRIKEKTEYLIDFKNMKSSDKMEFLNYGNNKTNDSDFGRYFSREETKIVSSDDSHISIRKVNFTKKSLLNSLSKMESYQSVAEKFYKEQSGKIQSKLEKANKELEKISDNNEWTDDDEIRYIRVYPHILRGLLKLQLIPGALVVAFMRVISYITATSLSEKYTNTTDEPANPIYHVSDSKGLKGVLTPRRGGTNIQEFLPPRISFGEDILSACHAIPRYFIYEEDESKIPYDEKSGLYYRDLYVYQGIQDKGKTTYLKPELVYHALPATLQNVVKEVCVTSPIKVKLTKKVRIWCDRSKRQFDPKMFVKYDVLEEY